MPKQSKRKQPPAAPTGFTQAQVDAAVAARDRAASGNPKLVRRAFLGGGPIQIGAVKIEPLTIGAFWLLEEIGHPFACQTESGATQRRKFYADVADAAYIMTDPRAARGEWQKGRAAFEAAAFSLVCKIPLSNLHEVINGLDRRITEAMDMMPPGGASTGKSMFGAPAPNPGLGWGLVLLDFLLSEYSGDPDYWQWVFPLTKAFPLFAAGQVRAGVKPGGPTYSEQEVLAAIRANAPKQ